LLPLNLSLAKAYPASDVHTNWQIVVIVETRKLLSNACQYFVNAIAILKLTTDHVSGIHTINGLLRSDGSRKDNIICWKIGNKITNDNPINITVLNKEVAALDTFLPRTALLTGFLKSAIIASYFAWRAAYQIWGGEGGFEAVIVSVEGNVITAEVTKDDDATSFLSPKLPDKIVFEADRCDGSHLKVGDKIRGTYLNGTIDGNNVHVVSVSVITD
jgi:hypothetical protein